MFFQSKSLTYQLEDAIIRRHILLSLLVCSHDFFSPTPAWRYADRILLSWPGHFGLDRCGALCAESRGRSAAYFALRSSRNTGDFSQPPGCAPTDHSRIGDGDVSRVVAAKRMGTRGGYLFSIHRHVAGPDADGLSLCLQPDVVPLHADGRWSVCCIRRSVHLSAEGRA